MLAHDSRIGDAAEELALALPTVHQLGDLLELQGRTRGELTLLQLLDEDILGPVHRIGRDADVAGRGLEEPQGAEAIPAVKVAGPQGAPCRFKDSLSLSSGTGWSRFDLHAADFADTEVATMLLQLDALDSMIADVETDRRSLAVLGWATHGIDSLVSREW